jgi:uncharacterized protein (UPF0264 family)
MSKWLASIQSLEEAQTLLEVLPDILDIKKPSKGALGALSIEKVTENVYCGTLPNQRDNRRLAYAGKDY